MSEFRVIDGRDMVPPEPLEAALDALETLPEGDHVTLLLYCQPGPLYDILNRDGYCWDERARPDGTREIRIGRSPLPDT